MLRFRRIEQRELPQNWAELLIKLGRDVRKQLRRQIGIEDASRRSGSTPENCRLALVFRNSDDVLKLRALVENWPRSRIVRELALNQSSQRLQSLPENAGEWRW